MLGMMLCILSNICSDHRTGLEPVSPRMSRVVTNYTNGGAGRLFILPAVFIFIPA
jgi:hypothetical protein